MPAGNGRPARIIALMNQKGGVGKTTTTVNLAAGLAAAGRPTLLVDLDPQAHATMHLGIDPAGLDRTVYDGLLDPESDPAGLAREARPYLWLLPSETDLAGLEPELADAPDRVRRLDRLFRALGDRFEFILIDCPPSLGLLTLNALAAAREVLIPMQAHFLALQGVGKLLETVRLVSSQVNPALTVAGVVLCMHDATTTHSQEVVTDLERFFDDARATESPWRAARVYRPAVRRNIKLAECPSFGQTVFEYAPQAPGAADYRALAEQVAREWDARHRQDSPDAAVAAPSPSPDHQPPTIAVMTGAPGAGARR